MMALPPTLLSNLLYLAAPEEVHGLLEGKGYLSEKGLADPAEIRRMSKEARTASAASEMPGPNHADLLADALLDGGMLSEVGVRAYHTDLRGA